MNCVINSFAISLGGALGRRRKPQRCPVDDCANKIRVNYENINNRTLSVAANRAERPFPVPLIAAAANEQVLSASVGPRCVYRCLHSLVRRIRHKKATHENSIKSEDTKKSAHQDFRFSFYGIMARTLAVSHDRRVFGAKNIAFDVVPYRKLPKREDTRS